MAGLDCSVQSGGSTGLTEVALDGTNEKCVIRITAPTNQRLKIKSVGIFFDGVTATAEPVMVTLCRVSTDGTTTSVTPKLLGVGSETPQATAGYDASANPTKGDVLASWRVPAVHGYQWIMPMGSEILVPGGGKIGLFAKAAAAVNLMATVNYEE